MAENRGATLEIDGTRLTLAQIRAYERVDRPSS